MEQLDLTHRAKRSGLKRCGGEEFHDSGARVLVTVDVRRGMADAALQYLSQAVAVSPEAGAQARHDPDFEPLRGTALFEELTEQPQHEPAPRKRGAAES